MFRICIGFNPDPDPDPDPDPKPKPEKYWQLKKTYICFDQKLQFTYP